MWHIVTAQKPLSRWFSTPCQTQSQSSSLWGTPLMPCWKKSEFNSDTVGNSSGCFPLLLPRHKTPGRRFRSSHLLARQTANTWYFLLSFFFLAYYGCRQNFPKLWGLGERQGITAGKIQRIFLSNHVKIFDCFPPKITFLFINPVLFPQVLPNKPRPEFWVWLKHEGAAQGRPRGFVFLLLIPWSSIPPWPCCSFISTHIALQTELEEQVEVIPDVILSKKNPDKQLWN